MKKTKLEKGITLIALIITIVILLTLAVVAISSVSDTGIIQYAKKTVRASKKAKIEEEIINIINAMNMDIYENSKEYIATKEEIDESERDAMSKVLGTPVIKLEEHFTVDPSTVMTTDWGARIFYPETLYLKGLLVVEEMENGEKYIASIPCTYKTETDIKVIIEMETSDSGLKITRFSLGEIQPKTIAVATQRAKIEVKVDSEGNPMFNADGDKIVTDKDGNVLENVVDVRDGVPIPNGFYYVTGTRDTGVVISDSPLDENDQNGGNNGNQFVWVPVEINPELRIIVDSEKMIKNIRILTLSGQDETINVNGFEFRKTIPLTNNTVYEIITTYNDDTKEDKLVYVDNCYKTTYETASVRGLIALFTSEGATEEQLFETMKENIQKENPDAVVDTNMEILKAFVSTVNGGDTEVNYTETRTDDQASVLKYGGFYLARYEMSNAGIKKGVYPSSATYEEMNSKIESYNSAENSFKLMMPTAAAWDATCSWLIRSGRLSETVVYYNAQSYGNHREKLGSSEKATLQVTGSIKTTNVNNFYDLTGNLEEWTTETDGTYHVARGSTYKKDILIHFYEREPATAATDTAGCRPMLYIK